MINRIISLFYPDLFDLGDKDSKTHRYAKAVYFTGLVLGGFYLYKYNFEFHVSTYNWPMIFCLICGLVWPHLFKRSNSIQLIAGGIWFFWSALLLILLYSAGGLKAPGIFWMIAIPVTGATIYGDKGLISSSAGIFIYVYALRYLEIQQQIPMELQKIFNFDQEKYLNLITFSIYFLFIIRNFISSQNRLIETISTSRADTEGLLRILIHDVANPACIIRGNIDVMKAKYPELQTEKALERIDRSSGSIISILEKIRQMRALNDGKAKLVLGPVDVVSVIRNMILLNASRLEEKKIEVLIQADQKVVHVVGDEVILTTIVFNNLLTNAIKFSPENSKIVISIHKGSMNCVIKFRDYGIGIPKEILGSLFDVKKATSRKGTAGEVGTGYGLPLVKEYLRKMNVSISVETVEASNSNEQPSGSTFTLEIPLATEFHPLS